jgi:FlaG/FlaF family flagellin (archaellin)
MEPESSMRKTVSKVERKAKGSSSLLADALLIAGTVVVAVALASLLTDTAWPRVGLAEYAGGGSAGVSVAARRYVSTDI